jgi:hypothetical protein
MKNLINIFCYFLTGLAFLSLAASIVGCIGFFLNLYMPVGTLVLAMIILVVVSYFLGRLIWHIAFKNFCDKRELPLDVWDSHELD